MIGIEESLASFDGADMILRRWADGLAPDPDLMVWEWADLHRFFSPSGANVAGPWRKLRTPLLRLPLFSVSGS